LNHRATYSAEPPKIALATAYDKPTPSARPETYSVVVNNVRVQELLFALARDAKLQIDIDPSLTGTVTLNAIDQTLPQLLSRIARQVDMRYEMDGDTLIVSRDGAPQTMTVQLADRKKLDTDIWNKLNSGSDISSPVTGLGILGSGSGGDAPLPGGFHMPFVGSSSLKVGALVEPLTAQMADYLGVGNGLMVKQVARKSQAAAAGMKAFDVILKVGTDNIATVSDWDRAMRANQGKNVAVTILRDKKQQTLTMLVDTKKKGGIEFNGVFDQDCPLMAFADQDAAGNLALDQSAAEEMRRQAEALQRQVEQWKNDPQIWHFEISPEQAEAFRKQAEQFRDAFEGQQSGIDPKQMDELKKQMQEWQKQFDGKPFVFDQKQLDELKKQMEEMQARDFGHLV